VPEVELEVPARAEYVGLVRLVVSALVGGRRVVDEELLDDLALAVSEACTLAVGTDGSIEVVYDETDEAVVVEVRGVLQPAVATGDVPDPLQLMRALVDKVEVADGRLRLHVLCHGVPAGTNR
jgi:anti-sigma regulatory factor (Ser/Thr protein kinase)